MRNTCEICYKLLIYKVDYKFAKSIKKIFCLFFSLCLRSSSHCKMNSQILCIKICHSTKYPLFPHTKMGAGKQIVSYMLFGYFSWLAQLPCLFEDYYSQDIHSVIFHTTSQAIFSFHFVLWFAHYKAEYALICLILCYPPCPTQNSSDPSKHGLNK